MLFVIILCVLIVSLTEYFFTQTDTKFSAYLELRSASMIVENVPSRIVLLYFTNINNILDGKIGNTYPEYFSYLAHDQAFGLNLALSKDGMVGTDM